MALGQAMAETKVMQDYQLAMIPIMKERSEMELEIRGKAFKQEIEQTKQMSLLTQRLQPDPVLMPAPVAVAAPGSKNLIYAGIAALAFFLLRK